MHERSPILEETHYYPFGLTMAGISSKAAGAVANRMKFNGIEETKELDLNQYDAFFRTFDPQIGRFLQIDPKIESADAWSPYSAMLNNPILHSDPLGDSSVVPGPVRVSQTSSPYNTFAPFLYQGYAATKAEIVRNQYNKDAAKLNETDIDARNDLKEKARTKTPEPFNTIIEKGRPMAKERAKVKDPNFKPNASKTNPEVNDVAKTSGVLGKAFLAAGIVQSGYTIATSDKPVQETVTEGTGWTGAIYGGGQGATIGVSVGGPYGSFFGGIVGSAIGFFLGKTSVDRALNGGNADNVRNNREIVPDWNPRPGGGLGN